MNCPKCKKPIPDEIVIREAATINGRKGGYSRPPITHEKAQEMAKKRWKK